MKSAQNSSGRITIRLPQPKLEVYQEFKRIVTQDQHSDVCYVIGELMEAYVTASKQIPDPDKQVVLRFMKQNIQINMGCTFNYNVKKTKRLPQPKHFDTLSKNYILPNLIQQWPTLKPQAQQYWQKRLLEAGIIPAGSNPATQQCQHQPCDKCHTQLHKLKKIIKRLTRVFQWKQRGVK